MGETVGPELMPRDVERSARLAQAQRSNRFVAQNLGRWMQDHPGSYAFVCGDDLVAINDDPAAAKRMARDQGYDLESCLIVLVPVPGASHYF